jgi:predicted enzyme related to lactoylglutathione lyase
MSDGGLRLEIFVSDIERSVVFYERVLSFVRKNESPGYVSMRRGVAQIGIGLASELSDAHPLKPRSGERVGVGVEIVVEVEDVDAAYGAVQSAGYPTLSPLKERPWGLRDFRIVDPDGYYLRVTSFG